MTEALELEYQMRKAFRKGDRVRVVKETFPGGPQIGDEGEVLSFVPERSHGDYPVAVIWPNGRRQSGFHPGEIEVIQ